MPSQGGDASQLTREGGFGLQELDDRLYFTRANQPGLWSMQRNGRDVIQVFADLDVGDWGSWAVREDTLFFVERQFDTRPRAYRIVRRDLTTGEQRELWSGNLSIPRGDPSLSVSDRGDWLVFGLTERSNADLMILDAAPGPDSFLTVSKFSEAANVH